MNYDALPQFVLVKLLALDEMVAALTAEADEVQRGIEDRRGRLWGNARRADDKPQVLTEELNKLTADEKVLQKRLQAEQSVLSACKLWLDRLYRVSDTLAAMEGRAEETHPLSRRPQRAH